MQGSGPGPSDKKTGHEVKMIVGQEGSGIIHHVVALVHIVERDPTPRSTLKKRDRILSLSFGERIWNDQRRDAQGY